MKSEDAFKELINAKDKVAVLFYASWCPYSQDFLPIFESYAKDKENNFARILTDDEDDLVDEYEIEVVPTVVFFNKGKVSNRLDGVSGVGLGEKQLTVFINECQLK